MAAKEKSRAKGSTRLVSIVNEQQPFRAGSVVSVCGWGAYIGFSVTLSFSPKITV